MILWEMMLEVVIGVLVMEVDKVANEVTHGSRQGDQHSEDIFLI